MRSVLKVILTVLPLAAAFRSYPEEWPLAPELKGAVAPVEAAANQSWLPVVLMHGLGDAGHNPGMQSLAKSVAAKYPGVHSVAVDVADTLESFIQPLQQQIDEFAEAVRADPLLAGGFNAVGLSQGGIIVRGYIQQYNDPPVNNFVSVCGVLNGVANCPLAWRFMPLVCPTFKKDPYAQEFKDLVVFPDYYVTSENKTQYVEGNRVLAPLSNQVPGAENATYKRNFAALGHLRMIMAEKDTMVYPKESEQFGAYAWGAEVGKAAVRNYTQMDYYQQDLFGLQSLDRAGKLSTGAFKGNHLQFNMTYWDDEVLPWLGTPVSS